MAGAVSSSERCAEVYFYTHAPGLPAFIGLDLLWLDYVHEPLFFPSSFFLSLYVRDVSAGP